MQGWTATTRHGVMRKGSTKVLNKHTYHRATGNLFTKNLQSKVHLDHRKAFNKQSIPAEASCLGKETVDI